MKQFKILKNVTIELLNYCNSNCIHCYWPTVKPYYIDYEDIKLIVDQAYEAGTMQITLTGGEPLLHPELSKIIEYIKQKNMAINLLTSLNVEPEKLVENIGKCDKIGISIYGSNNLVHDKITNKIGSFSRLIINLKKLVSLNLFITLNITILKENVNDIRNIVSLCNELNVPFRMNYILHGKASIKHEADAKDLVTNIDFLTSDLIHEDNSLVCSAGNSTLWVDYNLDVFPCTFFKMKIGNLKNDTIKNIFEKSDLITYLRNLQKLDFVKCNTCDIKRFCTPCIGENYNTFKEVTIPCKFNCRVGEKQYEIFKTITQRR